MGNAGGRRDFPIQMFFIWIGIGRTPLGDALISWILVDKGKICRQINRTDETHESVIEDMFFEQSSKIFGYFLNILE